jgi:hypothetical protein
LKEEALDRTMWRACFGRRFGPVVRQTTKWVNEWIIVMYHYPRLLSSQSSLSSVLNSVLGCVGVLPLSGNWKNK